MFNRIAVFGVGAIGGTIGGYLTRAGHDVTLIDQWAEHVETMKRDGLEVTASDEEFTVPVNAMHLGEACNITEPFDLIFLSMKSYDTVWATHFILRLLSPTGVIVSAQNGINDETIAPIAGYTRTLGCVITLGAGMYDPGNPQRTSVSSRMAFKLGELNGMETERIKALAEMLSVVGPTHVTTNLWGERWAKLAVNSMANPICALTSLGSAASREAPGVVDVTVKIGAEVVQVGAALGVHIEPINGVPAQMYVDAAKDTLVLEELKSRLAETAKELGAGRPSMLQDVMKGRRTEIEFLDGYVARRGVEVGVPTPACDAITSLIKQVERGEIESEPSNIKYMEAFM
ncbi:MAG: 2-dehydropantoate 2-reductase [SAR202 cluster bacterium]|jgi:2-dehydropantoate 2-reductase|nr:2-dehydropantoate 2-reductase [SAR202 cluster bacterium]MDP6300650.1 2-dehydropantoate 2-reductase [SAR202 cluster bacterium]MDP7102336.1 2-dehydropantoate 2-reductase [SAR202 cluster bacterium]MDP7225469.1 2-dehydropantoate 2-reductase [SAR202 cluster bacterium]MDP7532654.1 2-dehydropantoate 2-reductase [SAR202 cluster bacterium]|tara:strand:+ start:2531 stop:3565 length:1035 start_codon:yes stop_codon:yes gene_type:complete